MGPDTVAFLPPQMNRWHFAELTLRTTATGPTAAVAVEKDGPVLAEAAPSGAEPRSALRSAPALRLRTFAAKSIVHGFQPPPEWLRSSSPLLDRSASRTL